MDFNISTGGKTLIQRGEKELPDNMLYLVGGWTNLFEKYDRQIGSFPQKLRVKIQKKWNIIIITLDTKYPMILITKDPKTSVHRGTPTKKNISLLKAELPSHPHHSTPHTPKKKGTFGFDFFGRADECLLCFCFPTLKSSIRRGSEKAGKHHGLEFFHEEMWPSKIRKAVKSKQWLVDDIKYSPYSHRRVG